MRYREEFGGGRSSQVAAVSVMRGMMRQASRSSTNVAF